jgi:hypothetical protein
LRSTAEIPKCLGPNGFLIFRDTRKGCTRCLLYAICSAMEGLVPVPASCPRPPRGGVRQTKGSRTRRCPCSLARLNIIYRDLPSLIRPRSKAH